MQTWSSAKFVVVKRENNNKEHVLVKNRLALYIVTLWCSLAAQTFVDLHRSGFFHSLSMTLGPAFNLFSGFTYMQSIKCNDEDVTGNPLHRLMIVKADFEEIETHKSDYKHLDFGSGLEWLSVRLVLVSVIQPGNSHQFIVCL